LDRSIRLQHAGISGPWRPVHLLEVSIGILSQRQSQKHVLVLKFAAAAMVAAKTAEKSSIWIIDGWLDVLAGGSGYGATERRVGLTKLQP